MSSHSKESTAHRLAAARRRQRVFADTLPEETMTTTTPTPTTNDENEHAYARTTTTTTPQPPTTTRQDTTMPMSSSLLSRRIASSMSTSRTPSSPVRRDALQHENEQVAHEAAMVLASAKKKPQTTSRTTTVSLQHSTTTSNSIRTTNTTSPIRPRTTPGPSANDVMKEVSSSSSSHRGLSSSSVRTTSRTPERTSQALQPTSTTSQTPLTTTKATASTTKRPEPPKTVEEREPAVSPQAPLTAATLTLTSTLYVHNRHFQKNLQVQTEDDHDVVLANGLCLGHSQEVWKMDLVIPASTLSIPNDNVLRYGDTISLCTTTTMDYTTPRFLGIRPQTQPGTDFVTYTVGYHVPESGPIPDASMQWTIIRAVQGQEGLVRVGPLAVETWRKSLRRRRTVTAALVSGDGILLRNVQTGGLLSIDHKTGKTTLLTDSYPSHQSGKEGGNTLLGRLQSHDMCVPNDNQVFYFLHATVPTTPLWICTSENTSFSDRNAFLEGSYLTMPGRHKLSQSVHASVFDKPSVGTVSLPGLEDEEWSRRQLTTAAGQEQYLVDQVLGSFLGLEGPHIKAHTVKQTTSGRSPTVSFRLEQDNKDIVWDANLRNLVEQLLPLSDAFVNVRQFVSSHLPGYEYGFVMQAFCERLQVICCDFVTFVGQLEKTYHQEQPHVGQLRALLVNLRSSMHSMWVLNQATEVVRHEKGGALLNALRDLKLSLSGDSVASDILTGLLEAAAAPYMTILSQWVRDGILYDPHKEFMIEYHKAKSWENRYTLTNCHVLKGLLSDSKQTVSEILSTGRYWNAVRLCRKEVRTDNDDNRDMHLAYHSTSSVISSFVRSMYQKASRVLVDLLLDDCRLLDMLRLTKRYFLLDHGDFFVHFMDAAEDELLKEISSVSHGRIHHWLNTSIHLTEQDRDGGLMEDRSESDMPVLSPSSIEGRFASESLMDHLDKLHAESGGLDTHEAPTPLRHAYGGMASEGLTGLDVFVVDFASVPFPLSLVLTTPVMESYRLLFRHLFFAKHVERRLVGIWQDHLAVRELQSSRGALGRTFLLRQRMLHLLQNLIYYMMLEVIEPNWIEMQNLISDPDARTKMTVDDIIEIHTNFLRKTLEACLLTNRNLLRALTKLMNTCLLFSDQMKRFMKATRIEEDRLAVANEKRRTIQRNLNDRGGNLRRISVSQKMMEEALVKDMTERKERVKQQAARVSRETTSDSYQRMIGRFEEVFSDNLLEFMVQLKYSDDLFHTHKVNLGIRLDYNGYVSKALNLETQTRRLNFG